MTSVVGKPLRRLALGAPKRGRDDFTPRVFTPLCPWAGIGLHSVMLYQHFWRHRPQTWPQQMAGMGKSCFAQGKSRGYREAGMADGAQRGVEEEVGGWAPLKSLVKGGVGAERQKERLVGARAMCCLPSASTGSPGQSGTCHAGGMCAHWFSAAQQCTTRARRGRHGWGCRGSRGAAVAPTAPHQ